MSGRTARYLWLAMALGLGSRGAFGADLPPPEIPAGQGVNIHFTRPGPGEMKRFAEAGFGLVRMDMPWAGIERTRGTYDFSDHDELLGHLSKVGARPIYILDYANPLYNNGLAPTTDADRAAFARFAAAAASHFRGKRVLFEIWNEPNLDGFWKPKANQHDYAKLAVVTAKAMRAADPEATILAPGSSGFPWEFLETAFAAGLIEDIDAVSIHPYRGGPPESASEDYGRLRALIGLHAKSPSKQDLPIISSEWGYSTVNVSEATQAMYLPRQWLANLASGVNTSIFYDWKDDGDDPKEPEHRFGTVRRDLEPKPSFLAAQALIRSLRGYTFRHRLKGSTPDEWKLLFVAADGPNAAHAPLVVATWHASGSRPGEAGGTAPEYRKVDDAAPEGRDLRRLAAIRWRPGALVADPGEAPLLHTRITNPEASPARIEFASESTAKPGRVARYRFDVAPSESITKSLPLQPQALDAASRGAVMLSITWNGEPLPALAPIEIWRTEPVTLSAAPRRGALEVVVANHRNTIVEGALVVRGGADRADGKERLRVRPLKGRVEVPVQVPLKKAQSGIEFEEPGKRPLAYLAPRRYELFVGFHEARPPDVAFNADLHVDNAGTGPKPLAVSKATAEDPASHAIEVPYQFDAGWRYLTIGPEKPMEIPAGARAAIVWVRGNTSGDVLNCRFSDRTGQTFQVHLGNLTKPGWSPMTIPLDGSEGTSHWGGANDGVPHPPLRWEALLLIDSVHRDEKSPPRTMAFASPFHVFDR
ncbi:cellulase family glycosylhydrolase [Aquisphaera insulae]|uniref:cellulase family glycosylhydrolase n=1 Tax=Aquisphaera insulae TaxID=2712864 RepID=UPI0013E9CDC0|nr:cellulase family glycosylhydrolase [Aquisphaera insulae]